MATDKKRFTVSTTSPAGETGSRGYVTPDMGSKSYVGEQNGCSATPPQVPGNQKAQECAPQLKHEREQKGWSQQELAQLIGVDVLKIQQWEEGTFYPEADDLLKLSKQFGKVICI